MGIKKNLDRLRNYLESVNIEPEWYDVDFLNALSNYDTILDDIINGEVSIISFEETFNFGEYDIDQILVMYTENPLHLLFMSSDDPNEIILENFNNPKIVHFALEYLKKYDIDLKWIRNRLQHVRKDSSVLMQFDAIVDDYYSIFKNEDES
ncbi:unnamed protein product [Brachionus calyciflorus]|uniref:Uncharacterized protein n=1 Tax=Brachionus calyciflorus TaxID=104777 RepID=A0A813VVC7_9BILA|nr:unnamed protein product [Brachionus calyciflorus]